MADFSNSIPQYLVHKKNIVRLVVFTALFAIVFINIYAPFGVEYWYSLSKWGLLAYSSLVIITGILVVVISRIIMYHYTKHRSISIWNYLVWVAVEISCMSLFYTLFEVFILKDERFFMDLLKISIQNTALVLLLPYSVLWLYFSWQDKKSRLEALEGHREILSNNLVPFKDERGKLRLSIKKRDLLYIESADNYVKIHYKEYDKTRHYLLRNSMKKVEMQLAEEQFIRCHRSYLVNKQLTKSLKREKEGLFIELDTQPLIRIPVTKTYIDAVIRGFS